MEVMKAKYLIIAMLLLGSVSMFAQNADSIANPWKYTGFTSISFNQISLTNWAKGGESSVAIMSLLNFTANYAKGPIQWDNTAEFGYGLIKTELYPSIRKNDDKIDLNSKFGHKAFDKFLYSALINLKSQFAPGYNYPNDSVMVSKFFAPAYLIISVGLDYKPTDKYSIYLSPATGRFIFVLDEGLADLGSYGVEPAIKDSLGNIITHGKRLKPEFGAYLTAKAELNLMENITLASKLDLFNNYTDKDPGNRKNIDVNWETNIVMKINEYIAASIYMNLIYDQNIAIPLYETVNGVKTKVGEGPRTQIKEALGIGFSYKL